MSYFVRTFLALIVFQWIALSQASAGCDEEIYQFAPRINYADLDFENWYPRHEDAVRELAPKSYRNFINIYREFPSYEHILLRSGIRIGTPYRDLLVILRHHRNQIAAKLDTLAADCERESRRQRSQLRSANRANRSLRVDHNLPNVYRLLADQIGRLADRFRVLDQPQGTRGVRISWERFHFIWEQVGDAVFEPESFFDRRNEADQLVDGYLNAIYGQWAEMRVALLVPKLKEFGTRAIDLSSNAKEVQAALATGKVTESEAKVKLDVVFEDELGRTVWGEVKSFTKPLSLSTAQFERVIASLDKQSMVRKKLNLKVRLQLFLLHGITPEAKRELLIRYADLGKDFEIVAKEVPSTLSPSLESLRPE